MIRGISALVLLLAIAACGGASLPPPQSALPPTQPPLTALASGTYTTAGFQPPVTFTVPEGWALAADTNLYANLRPVENDAIGVHLFRDPKAASQDASCPAAPEPGSAGAQPSWRPGSRGGPASW